MKSAVSVIRHVTWVGFWINALLMLIKIAIGHYGHSDALVADGVHSMSDFATDLIVLIFVGIAYKQADDAHPYGHGKFETLATLIIGLILFGVAVGIGHAGVKSALSALAGDELPRPDVWTIVVAVVSIAAKEMLFRYTAAAGRKVDSSALVANAWHHRSDAISSLATLLGVTLAFSLGEQWRVLDPIASVLIAFFIAWSAIGIARPAINELLEISLPQKQVDSIGEIIASTPGVITYHHLRTRRNGHAFVIDAHIKVDSDISVIKGHEIATEVERRLALKFGSDVVTYIHVEPYMAK